MIVSPACRPRNAFVRWVLFSPLCRRETEAQRGQGLTEGHTAYKTLTQSCVAPTGFLVTPPALCIELYLPKGNMCSWGWGLDLEFSPHLRSSLTAQDVASSSKSCLRVWSTPFLKESRVQTPAPPGKGGGPCLCPLHSKVVPEVSRIKERKTFKARGSRWPRATRLKLRVPAEI